MELDERKWGKDVRSEAKKVRLLLLTIPLVSSTALRAQSIVPTSVQQLVLTRDYQSNVARLFTQLPADVFQRCSTLVSSGSSVTVIEPATFATDGYPTAGFWRQSFPVSGCGNDTTINFFFRASADGKILSIVAAPGDTRADLRLQQDAVKYVMVALKAKAGDCAAFHVRTTRYVGVAPGGTGKEMVGARPWRETWTLAACGQSYDVPVTFIPDATGTTVQTDPAQVVRPYGPKLI